MDDQQQTIAFLSDRASYGELEATVEQIETHISIVFLVGDFAYKLRRAVRYSYLDYSRAELRENYCRAELVLNRRTAPELYLRVRAITRAPDGILSFDGTGTAVDWVLEMRRFDQNGLFDRLADLGHLTPEIMRDLTDRIVAFHKSAQPVMTSGGYTGIKEVIAANALNLDASCPPLDRSIVDHINTLSMTACTPMSALLDLRKAQGMIRRCHGDLHLRNICLLEGRPTIFDCIEFNDEFSCIDVLYDLAFLLMDLLHRRFYNFANLVFNRYFDRMADFGGLPVLPLFISIRAAIRAHVLISQYHKNSVPDTIARAQSYLSQAAKTLNQNKPCLIAIGGLSGTGKSTLAAALAPDFLPAPGARILRTDVIRKTLCGVAPETRLPVTAYSGDTTRQVYQTLRAQTAQVLAAGYPVIADATFLATGERCAMAAEAEHAGVPFFGFWLEAGPDVLRRRLTARRNDASDADIETLRGQEYAGTGDVDWHHVDANEPTSCQLTMIRARLKPAAYQRTIGQ